MSLQVVRERVQLNRMQIDALVQTILRCSQIESFVYYILKALWLKRILIQRLNNSVLVASLGSDFAVNVGKRRREEVVRAVTECLFSFYI